MINVVQLQMVIKVLLILKGNRRNLQFQRVIDYLLEKFLLLKWSNKKSYRIAIVTMFWMNIKIVSTMFLPSNYFFWVITLPKK